MKVTNPPKGYVECDECHGGQGVYGVQMHNLHISETCTKCGGYGLRRITSTFVVDQIRNW